MGLLFNGGNLSVLFCVFTTPNNNQEPQQSHFEKLKQFYNSEKLSSTKIVQINNNKKSTTKNSNQKNSNTYDVGFRKLTLPLLETHRFKNE